MTAGLSSLFFSFENIDKYAKETVFWNDLSFLRVYLGFRDSPALTAIYS